jgi:hypothetical protein
MSSLITDDAQDFTKMLSKFSLFLNKVPDYLLRIKDLMKLFSLG